MRKIPCDILFVDPKKLNLHAIGNIDAAPIGAGIHLRWSFDPQLGFPAYGFLLYRGKTHLEHICLSLRDMLTDLKKNHMVSKNGITIYYSEVRCPENYGITVGNPSQVNPGCSLFTIILRKPSFLGEVVLDGKSGYALIIGLNGEKPVVTRQISLNGSQMTAEFNKIMVESIKIFLTQTAEPINFCYYEPDVEKSRWSDNLLPVSREPDSGYGIPLTTASYNLHHRYEGNPKKSHEWAKGDFQEAVHRVEGKKKFFENQFLEMRESFRIIADSGIPGGWYDMGIFYYGNNDGSSVIRPLDLAMLTSLDPVMAKVLGFYYIDSDIEKNSVNDYLIIGRWAAWQLDKPVRLYTFTTVPEGTRVPDRFSLNGVVVTLPASGIIASDPQEEGCATRKALFISQERWFWFSDKAVKIRFTEPVHWAVLELGKRSSDLFISAFNKNEDTVFDIVTEEGDDPLSVEIVPKKIESISEIRIAIMSGGKTGFSLYGWRILPVSEKQDTIRDFSDMVCIGAFTLNATYANAPPLPPPANVRIRGVPIPVPMSTDNNVEMQLQVTPRSPLGMGFRWDPPLSTSLSVWPQDTESRPPTDAAVYNAQYQYLGNGDTPLQEKKDSWEDAMGEKNAIDFIAASSPAVTGTAPPKRVVSDWEDLAVLFPPKPKPKAADFSSDADLWFEPWINEGWYTGRVRARDLFGRYSDWSNTSATLIDNIINPPPPVGVEAKLLQASDPGLTLPERAHLKKFGDGCITVTWRWSQQLRLQAPQVKNFRVYVKRRTFNQHSVVITSVIRKSPKIICKVKTDIIFPVNGLFGCTLTSGGVNPFIITGNSPGPDLTSTLTLLEYAADPAVLPGKGNAQINVANHLLIEIIKTELNIPAGLIDCHVRFVNKNLPVIKNLFTKGELVDAKGRVYHIHANGGLSDTWILAVHIPQKDPSGVPVPGIGQISLDPSLSQFENSSDTTTWDARVAKVALTQEESYGVIIPPIGLYTDRNQPIRYGRIGVSSADDSTRYKDLFVQPGPPWDKNLGGLPGREGCVSGPTSVAAVFRESLPEPKSPAFIRLYTTHPDFYGKVTYEVQWTNAVSSERQNTFWHVFRTTDLALFSLFNPDPKKSKIRIAALSQGMINEIVRAYGDERNVKKITDQTLQELASCDGADQAFSQVTVNPLQADSDQVFFVDSMEGRNPVRYIWRIRAVDKGGNLSPMSRAGQPVWVPNTIPPSPVHLTVCQGGNRQVILQWKKNREQDLAGYMVFSTEKDLTLNELEDLRPMRKSVNDEEGIILVYNRDGDLIDPTIVMTKDSIPQEPVSMVECIRLDLSPGKLYHYRILAYDTAGNPSGWSRILSARTRGFERPKAPDWQVPNDGQDGLFLSWTPVSPVPILNCLVQRSRDKTVWTNISSWLGPGIYSTIDREYQKITDGKPVYYRVRAMFPDGQINKEFKILKV